MKTKAKTVIWRRITNTSITNLSVLYVNNLPVGMIDKPTDTKTDKNAWRLYRGFGETTEFLKHEWDKQTAVKFLEQMLVGA